MNVAIDLTLPEYDDTFRHANPIGAVAEDDEDPEFTRAAAAAASAAGADLRTAAGTPVLF